jgi:hypothetical protein
LGGLEEAREYSVRLYGRVSKSQTVCKMGIESGYLSWLVLGLMELLSHLVSSLKDCMATSETLR